MNEFTLAPPFADVPVRVAAVPKDLRDAVARGVLWQAAPGRFLLEAPEAARFLVTREEGILVEPCCGADADEILRYLHMTPTAALACLRGVLALHAAVVADEDGAVVIAGDSGAGKSTLAAAFAWRGWRFFDDDLALIDQDDSGRAVVFPGRPEAFLWPDTLAKLGQSPVKGADIGSLRCRMAFPDETASQAMPVRAFVSLAVDNHDQVRKTTVRGAESFRLTGRHLYNTHISDALLDKNRFLAVAGALARNARFRRLHRPRGLWQVEELIDWVLAEGS